MKLSIASVFALSLAQIPQPAVPSSLSGALKLEPGIRILNPATDLREYSQAELEKFVSAITIVGDGSRGL